MTMKMTELEINLKKGLTTYKVGSRNNIATQGFKHVNIALFGPTGSGKSSFIQIAEKILLGKTTVITQSDAKEGTIILLEFLTDLKFHLFDTRGFFDLDKDMEQELDNILGGRIRPSQVIVRGEEEKESLGPGQSGLRKGPIPLKDKMHGVICILGHKDPKAYGDKMTSIRGSLKREGYSPVGGLAFVKEGDFADKDKRESLMVKMSASMGSPRDRTYAFVNHIATETEISTESAVSVMEILDTALIAAEGYIKVQQQRETYAKERAKPTADAAHMPIKDFISQLAEEHNWDDTKVNEAAKKMDEEDIYDVAGLRQFWGEVKSKFSLGMRSAIQTALFPK
ncbi:Hypp3685 [Branchiostoma lanceolatum]|nr:Hypp3685 [Branchiostoma lanceolatum]